MAGIAVSVCRCPPHTGASSFASHAALAAASLDTANVAVVVVAAATITAVVGTIRPGSAGAVVALWPQLGASSFASHAAFAAASLLTPPEKVRSNRWACSANHFALAVVSCS